MSVFTEIILLIIKKMKMKMKNRSHRYDLNRPRPDMDKKYTIYITYFSIVRFNLLCSYKSDTKTR